MKNTFSLPTRFPNVIKFIERLREGDPPARAQGRLVRVREAALFVTTTHVYRIGKGWAGFGGYIAGRFNLEIYLLMDALTMLTPKHAKEAAAFLQWLHEEDAAHQEKYKLDELESKASDLGYKLVKK